MVIYWRVLETINQITERLLVLEATTKEPTKDSTKDPTNLPTNCRHSIPERIQPMPQLQDTPTVELTAKEVPTEIYNQFSIPISTDPTKCQECGCKTRVADNNLTKEGIVRRRYCSECKTRFNTVELRQQEYREHIRIVDQKAIQQYQVAMKAIGTIISTTLARAINK